MTLTFFDDVLPRTSFRNSINIFLKSSSPEILVDGGHRLKSPTVGTKVSY
jgi:hypothetical protein